MQRCGQPCCVTMHQFQFHDEICQVARIAGLANFFEPTSDLENFSRLVNLPFLFVLRKVTLLRGLVNLGNKTHLRLNLV